MTQSLEKMQKMIFFSFHHSKIHRVTNYKTIKNRINKTRQHSTNKTKQNKTKKKKSLDFYLQIIKAQLFSVSGAVNVKFEN